MRDWMSRRTWTWMLIGIPLGAVLGMLLAVTWGWEFSGVLGVVLGEVLGMRIWVLWVLR